MSIPNVPEGLKNVTPFLQRAAQLREREPVVSYYANYYAAKLAIQKASKDNRAFIDELLNILEKQRKDIGDNEAISNDLVGYAHIENFAIKIFSKADDEDREGQGSQKTAKNFVAAANFLELLKVFGEIDSEIEEKIKYAKWRAADIVKAIRDGRQPTPPPGSKPNQALPEAAGGDIMDGVIPSTGIAAGTSSAFVTSQSSFGPASTFPTISNFPSPPLSSTNTFNTGHSGADPWNQPSPFTQDHNNTLVSPPTQPPVSFNTPASLPDVGLGYQPTSTSSTRLPGSNPVSPPSQTLPSQQFGYSNGFTQQPQMPAPQPTPFSQQGFNSPSAPYHQQQQQQQQQQQLQPVPYSTVPIVLDPAVSTQVQKHCKWTISSLTYDDVPTAIDNLEKALALLRPYHNKQT